MKQCPGCGLVPSMDDDTISNGDSTYHRDCYRKLAEAVAEEGPDPIERIADALERLADKYAGFRYEGSTATHYNPTPPTYDPLAHAEKR